LKNYLQRNFFAAYEMPDDSKKVEFRIFPDTEVAGAYTVQIVGFSSSNVMTPSISSGFERTL
jgi:hypothetical protein